MTSLFSERLDSTLTKAGKDSEFKFKTEQKSIIEAVVDFSHHLAGLLILRDGAISHNRPQIASDRIIHE